MHLRVKLNSAATNYRGTESSKRLHGRLSAREIARVSLKARLKPCTRHISVNPTRITQSIDKTAHD